MDRSVCIRCKVNLCVKGYHFCAECRAPKKVCNVCGEEKPYTQTFFQSKKGVPGYFYPTCKVCRGKISNKHAKRRRAEDPEYRILVNQRTCAYAKRKRAARTEEERKPKCSMCGSIDHRKTWHSTILEKYRTCATCGVEKLLTEEFWFKNAHGYAFKLVCRSCSNEVSKKYQKDNWERLYEKRKQRSGKIIEALKVYRARRGCINCGESNPDLLQFHHREPEEKEFNLSTSAGTLSTKRIEEELEKCQILCYACHKKHHQASS